MPKTAFSARITFREIEGLELWDASGLNIIATESEYSRTCRPLHGSTSEGEGVGHAGKIGAIWPTLDTRVRPSCLEL